MPFRTITYYRPHEALIVDEYGYRNAVTGERVPQSQWPGAGRGVPTNDPRGWAPARHLTVAEPEPRARTPRRAAPLFTASELRARAQRVEHEAMRTGINPLVPGSPEYAELQAKIDETQAMLTPLGWLRFAAAKAGAAVWLWVRVLLG